MMEGKSDWATPTLMETPFWRDEMSPEEYEFERAYYLIMLMRGPQAMIDYKPLWKQNKEIICDLSDSIAVIELAAKMHKMTDEELDKIMRDKE